MRRFKWIGLVSLALLMVATGCASKKGGSKRGSPSESGQYGDGSSSKGGIGLGTLSRVYFGFDEADLSDDARDRLSKNAEIITKNKKMRVMIEGHCDERGSNEYNIALGERRSKAVINYLVNLGVKRSRLEMKSWGEERPLDPGKGGRAYSLNRRAEFVILAK